MAAHMRERGPGCMQLVGRMRLSAAGWLGVAAVLLGMGSGTLVAQDASAVKPMAIVRGDSGAAWAEAGAGEGADGCAGGGWGGAAFGELKRQQVSESASQRGTLK